MATRPLRMADERWVVVCTLWGTISEADKSLIVKAMSYMAEKNEEGPDDDADSDEE